MPEENPILTHLDGVVGGYSERTSGNDLYHFVRGCSRALLQRDRESYSRALQHWLGFRAEPKTMLAVYLAQEFALSELRPDLEALLEDIEAGRAFLPYYSQWVRAALASL